MMARPLPPMSEYDTLDEHLDDLEEPGANLLQDFVLRSNGAVSNDTPVSISNGYTSEESDYSVTTPSDEQMYADMSFLQSADTSELVEVVADFCENDDLTALTPQQQQVFAGKMIKGKTSKYRGVTQTSKTSWGAKYSAKRITNTCKTPDEAARAYDEYLKTNYPQKYPKFANFCVRCDRFVNPLGLPEFRNECCCDKYSESGSTEVESPAPASETDMDDEPRGDDGVLLRQGSSLSISSLKLSFLEDADPLFDETMLPSDQRGSLVKKDSFTIAAVESFTNDGSLDRIIKDIDRTSSSSKPSFTHSNSFGSRPSIAHQGSGNMVVQDFSPEEWQNLSEYLMTEQGQAATRNSGGMGSTITPPVRPISQQQQRGGYKKIHSLDFDDAMDHNPSDIKEEQFASVEDVDDLASAFMSSSGPTNNTIPSQTRSSPAFPALVEVQTPFLEKYWRNDRKNIQCFPYCPEHGDYYRVRIENLQHRGKGVCRAPVKVMVTIPTNQPLAPSGLLLLARCNSSFSRNEVLAAQQYLNALEIKDLQTVSAVGVVDKFGVLSDGSGVQFEVTFFPDVWKFEFDLPKKRRHTGGGAEADFDGAGSEFLYFFEIDVFYSTDKSTFQRLGHAESLSFQIGNTRTLLRQRNRMADDTTMGDSDRVLGPEDIPTKKRAKASRLQHGRASTIDVCDETDPAYAPSNKYITGEAIDSKSDAGLTTHADVDKLCRMDSNDALLDVKIAGTAPGSKIWKDHDDDVTEGPSTYGRYVSPKNGGAKLATEPEHGVTVATLKRAGEAAPIAKGESSSSGNQEDGHSWGSLFGYGAVSIPLSVVFMVISFISLVPFIILPPLSPAMVRLLDTLSDSELKRANSTCNGSDQRYVLNRLDNGGKKMCQYHSDGAVWARFVYFSGGKLIFSIIVFVPALLLSVFGLILFPVRPFSRALLSGASSIMVSSREYSRKSLGKPYSHAAQGVDGLV
ncbi:hypothetical protein Poli38472_003967 [Pythium oligandrum]|uniref:Transmembrane protein n=1 Tax=Pythium oligandrum TaxID=41045 RepID=A0A8K1CMD9_PYTOL|nr:hypothetical protein Poli38472_003967 [Pythium oligandrum]|eukprot:TMW66202.1 hypothetical protein Poli38472_003967 [Pythium oligandrum]